MKGPFWRGRVAPVILLSLVSCRPATISSLPPTTTSLRHTPATPTASLFPTSTVTPAPTSTAIPTQPSTPAPPLAPQPTEEQALTLPYTHIGDTATGRIRGRLFFPSEFIPSLVVYAVAADGSRFYREETQPVPPGEPGYEIPLVEPGTYHVYAYPNESDASFGGAYSFLAACEAGHLPPPPEGCWENPQHDLAPVEVRAGQAVEEVNIFDWYAPSLPSAPDDTSS